MAARTGSFFSKHSETVSHMCHSGIMHHTEISLHEIKLLKLCDTSVRENKQKTSTRKKNLTNQTPMWTVKGKAYLWNSALSYTIYVIKSIEWLDLFSSKQQNLAKMP